MAEFNKKFMLRALELAQKADAKVQPNPYVGAVVVKNGNIIGEGYHKEFGKKHAEPIAIDNAEKSCEGADLYVNLEPCSHMGKTPPCVDKIISEGISRVFIGISDPHENVKGDGIVRLKKAGLEVYVNVLKKKSIDINRKFLISINKNRPYILLKYAMTLDGYIATICGDSKWISNKESRKIVHESRHNYQGILVGSSTVIADNPRLTARLDENGFQPKPFVLDIVGELRTFDYNIFEREAVLITPNNFCGEKGNVKVYNFDKKKDGIIEYLDRVFQKEKIHSLMVEGGSRTLSLFVKNNYYDEVNVFVSPKFIGEGIKPLSFSGIKKIKNSLKLKSIEHRSLDSNIMLKGYKENVHWVD